MENYIGKKLELIEMPQLRYENPNVIVGNFYEVIYIEGSNFWIYDEDGKQTSFSKFRFNLQNK
jgi:hypothetical protein